MSRPPTPVRVEIRQTRPFPSPAQEAGVGLMRTADVIRRALAGVVEAEGITHQQYNVLRILRGSAPEPLPVLEIAARMIEQTPGITRLLDRLEARGLVRRERCRQDRRQVLCSISAAGRAAVGALDAPVERALERGFALLGREDTRRLAELLDRVRSGFRAHDDEDDPGAGTS
ncbi:MAG: MarR family transcriptional regulator [Thermoanaerobaculia bacterium]|nr:MAG: MarR family transcriptional regulator [Thermoanaerobaculia bacterium]